MDGNTRIGLAEAVGTAVLMMGGPGSAILASDQIGLLGVSLAFGLALLTMAYTIGPISGCHINPAVTIGLAVAGKVERAKVPFYVVGQLVGAAIGAVLIWLISDSIEGGDTTGRFAANGWGDYSPSGFGFGAMLVVELAFTALLVLVVLATTRKGFPAASGGLSVGLALTLIHLVTIPVDNTSVNPARSFGSALFSDSAAWEQLWAFIVFPIIGAVIGAAIWKAIGEDGAEA